MYRIKNNIHMFENREKPLKLTKWKANNQNTAIHLTKTKKKKEYEYYKCDYCHEEIKITKDKDKRTGGLLYLPKSLTKSTKNIELALHNRCINAVLREFELEREERKKAETEMY